MDRTRSCLRRMSIRGIPEDAILPGWAFVAGVLVHGGKHVEHALVREEAFRVQRGDVLAGNLADKRERAVIGKGVFHVGRHVRIAPPFGRAEKDAVGFFQVDFYGHDARN